jgi:hypothetical protein
MGLKIIVVPASDTRPCEVYLGDCVWPGHLLAVASSPEEADRLGAMWAARYGVPFHPLDRERLNPEADALVARHMRVAP